jgi:hypothetical protein
VKELGISGTRIYSTASAGVSLTFINPARVNPSTFLQYMVDAREKVEALLSFITAAEFRHACAMANVYSDEEDKLPPIPNPPVPEIDSRRRRDLGI